MLWLQMYCRLVGRNSGVWLVQLLPDNAEVEMRLGRLRVEP
jgi:hypothetical protein